MPTADCSYAAEKMTTELYYVVLLHPKLQFRHLLFPIACCYWQCLLLELSFWVVFTQRDIVLQLNVNKIKVVELIKRVTSKAQSQSQVKCSCKHTAGSSNILSVGVVHLTHFRHQFPLGDRRLKFYNLYKKKVTTF